MQKTKLTFILSLIISLSSLAQTVKNDLFKLNLKNHVKTTQEFGYRLIKDKNDFRSYKLDSIITSYDKNGNILSINKYKRLLSENKISDNGRENLYSYKYDLQKRIIELNFKSYDEEADYKITNKYDSNGLLLEENREYKSEIGEYRSQKEIFKYDSKGNMIEKYMLDNIDGEGSHYFVKYDSTGNKIKEGYAHDQYEYTYNNGKIASKKNLMEDGKIRYECTFQYDSNGNETEVKYHYPNEQPITIYKYKYEYDQNSNWIKKSMYNAEDILMEETERIIQYFE